LLESTKINKLDGIDLNLDLSRDYNNDHIDLSKLFSEIAFIKSDSHNIPNVVNGTLLRLRDITSTGEGNYDITYTLNDPSLPPIVINSPIETLYDLWNILGGPDSVSLNEEDRGKFYLADDPLDGYVGSNTSWEALAEYVNRVGFWYNSAIEPEKTNVNTISTVVRKDMYNVLKNVVKKYMEEPHPNNYNASIVDAPINQRNIIQPLKLGLIAEVTFESGQIVGA